LSVFWVFIWSPSC